MPIHAYDHPALTADVVLFALGETGLHVLLIQRGKPPFQGDWAFPGGFVDVGESPHDAAARELREETGIRGPHVAQLRAFGDPDRDPRGHTVTVAYLAVLAAEARRGTEAGSDAAQARWWSIEDLPPLAFDHAKILTFALHVLLAKLRCAPADSKVESVVPEQLSLGNLRTACRTIIERLEQDAGYSQVEQT